MEPHAHPERDVERELSGLEQKLASLLAHTRALRMANEALRRDLTAAHSRNQVLASRVATARERLDALLARIPASVE